MKITPQNIESEESIISGCILFPKIIEEVRDILKPEHFYKNNHQKIISAIFENHKKNQPTDLIALTVYLREKNMLNEIGGATKLATITDIPISTNPEYDCNKIKESFILRQTIETLNQGISACFENQQSSEIIDYTQKKILYLADNNAKTTFITMKDLANESVERYDINKTNNIKKLKTGIHKFDNVCGGFSGSKLITIAARPRVGKTAIMINMALYMAKKGTMVGLFELEMDKEDIFDRIVAGETGINAIRLGTGRLGEKDWIQINKVAGEKYNLPILVDDTGGLKIMELKRRCRKMKKEGCKIIFIDQLSKIIGDRRKKKFEEVTEIVEELGTFKKELKIPIVLLAQINRAATQNTEGKPTLENLKNTGQIEEESDIVILLNRPYLYTKKPEQATLAYFEVAKNRGGAESLIQLDWDAATTTFKNLAQPEGGYYQ